MKQRFGVVLFLLLVLVSFYTTSAIRPFIPKQVEKMGIHVDGALQNSSMDQEDPMNLMGMEHCENEDEECVKRRMIADAHLDYIYTQGQHHKP